MMRFRICAMALLAVPAISSAQTTTFTYDALGRLTRSDTVENGSPVTTEISYDPAGNRTQYKVVGGANHGNDPGTGAPAARRFIVVPLNGFTLIPIG